MAKYQLHTHESLASQLDKPSLMIYGEMLSIREAQARGYLESFKLEAETGVITNLIFSEEGLKAMTTIRREENFEKTD